LFSARALLLLLRLVGRWWSRRSPHAFWSRTAPEPIQVNGRTHTDFRHKWICKERLAELGLQLRGHVFDFKGSSIDREFLEHLDFHQGPVGGERVPPAKGTESADMHQFGLAAVGPIVRTMGRP